MPVARFQMSDGRIARFEVPEGSSPEQAQSMIEQHFRVQAPQQPTEQPREPTLPERIAGHPITRFALGAASPVLGAAQLVSEAVGSPAVTEHLQSLEAMKRAGMKGDSGTNRLLDMVPFPPLKAVRSLVDLLPADADVAGMAGTLASPAALGAMKIPLAASMLGRIGQGAGLGAGLGAVSPVYNDAFWAPKAAQVASGAVIGGALPPVIEGVSAVARGARNMLDPLLPGGTNRGASRILAETVGPRRAAVEAELSRPQELVPGSVPTGPEAAAAAGSPELAALQKIAVAHRPSKYWEIKKAQEAARLAAVQRVGKDEPTLLQAVAARETVGNKMYDAIKDRLVTTDDVFETLLARPSMAEAVKDAAKSAKETGGYFPSEGEQFSVGNLQRVKESLDAGIAAARNASRAGKRPELSETELMGTKQQFVKWLSGREDDWRKARETYAQMSKPIDEMRVGQQLEHALIKPVGEGERAAVFAGAMNDAPRTIKTATGRNVAERLDQVLTPESMVEVKSVLGDLTRKAEFDRMAPLGAARAAKAAQPFGLPASGPLNQAYMVVKTVLGRVSKGINEKTLDAMADALEVPANTLRLLRSAPDQARQSLVNRILVQKFGRAATVAGAEAAGDVSKE